MTIVKVRRQHALIDYFRSYKVLLDGEEINRLKNGAKININVPSGLHSLQLQIDWCFSNVVNFKVDDKVVEFECGNNFQGKRIFLGVLNTIGSSGDYLWLKIKK